MDELIDFSQYTNSRLPHETSKAFQAYTDWINQGYSRTIAQTSRNLKKSYELISRWYKKYNWHERALAYDNQMQLTETNIKIELSRKRLEEQEALVIGLQKLGSENLKRIAKMLDDEPELVNLKPMELLNCIKEGILLERLITGQSTEKTESKARFEFVYKVITGENPHADLIDKLGEPKDESIDTATD